MVSMSTSTSTYVLLLTRVDWSEYRGDAGELRIEVACIGRVLDRGNERRRHALVEYVFPVDVAEEWLAHDFLRVGGTRAETLVRFASQEFLEDRNRVARHVDWV